MNNTATQAGTGGRAATLVLRVRSCRGAVPAAPIEARFDAAGGSVGRAPGNLLVLDDAGKYISRVHAAVTLAGGRFHLSDQGANPSLVNGQPLGAGATAALAHGDVVTIGDYLLEVDVPAPPAEQDALATVVVPPPQAVPQAPLLAAAPAPPFAAVAQPLFAAPAGPADTLAMAGILSDGGAPPADPAGLLPRGPVPMPAWQPGGAGTPADHVPPERQAWTPPAIPADYDPLASLLAPARAAAPAPAAVAVPPPAPVPQVPAPQAMAAPQGVPAPQAMTVPQAVAAPQAVPAPQAMTAPQAAPAPQPVPPPATGDAVLRALLEGLGMPGLRSGHGPEALARLAGAMLRAATRGTMAVLTARALTKRESHIDMTMIAPRANNPLKFFPDADGALAQMLGGETPGYLPAEAALDAAFDDLKAHELAVLSGMRAALGVVVQRFDPAAVAARTAAGGPLDRLLPARRKARMWDSLAASYDELARGTDEDLQRLFGASFSLAYREQVERVRAGQPTSQPYPASSHVVE